MPNIVEKVMKGIGCCLNGNVCNEICPYSEFYYDNISECTGKLMEDAFELLKEQQAEIERLKSELAKVLRCKECKYFQEGIDINGEPFTRCNCGKKQPMTWGASVTPDWFCGHAEAKDGEQK